jgi:hypothetical protein
VKAILSFLLFLILASSPAAAATLNFSTVPKGETTKPLTFTKSAIVKSVEGALFVYGGNDFGIPGTGGVCALQADFSCIGGLSLLFNGTVSNLSFKGFFATTTDVATITAYSGNTPLSFQLVSGNPGGQIDISFAGVSGITRLDITTTALGAGKGIAYGDFGFDVDPPDTVPPPPLPEESLDFDSVDRGVNGNSINIGIAKITENNGGELFVYHTGDYFIPANGAVCALSEGFACMGDLLIEFNVPIFDLMFSGFFAKATDSMIVSLFNNDLLIFSGQFWGNTGGTILFDFRSFGVLTSILIEDRSDVATKGVAYGDFKYRIYDQPSPVPLPASLPLLMFGLTLLMLPSVRRRVRSAVA